MAKNKISKQAKRRLTVLTPLVFLAVGYLLFTVVTTFTELYQLKNDEKKYSSELKKLQGNSEELKTEITKLQDTDYVARYARENYLYTKDGEYVIKINNDDEKTKNSKLIAYDKYIIYGSYFLLSLIILYVLIKNHRRKKKSKKKKKA